jgi:hypothetical protein
VLLKDCTPIDKRLIPIALKALNFPLSLAPGLASSVISISLAKTNFFCNPENNISIASMVHKLGVPPPIKIV